MSLPPLPIDEVISELVEAMRGAPAVLLQAPTGAGKTTRVPGALLDAGLADLASSSPQRRGELIVLEPRRIAARSAARRTAQERGVKLGDEVGYQVRFDSKRTKHTRITFVTEGLFLRRLQEDPFLEGVSLVVFDEFHERNLDGDLSLALLRSVQKEAREDLKLLVMSATLNREPLEAFLESPPVIESRGRSYPVEIEYLGAAERPQGTRLEEEVVVRGVQRALRQSDGDVLVFLPGVGEIKRCAARLEPLLSRDSVKLFQLYGDQSAQEQDRALQPHEGRAVHLATNVAETSLTLPQVTAVVDSGLARKLHHDSGRGVNQLRLEAISRASATQRTGRAGRTSAGYCLRLWTEQEERSRPDEELPEIARVDVTSALLELFQWGESRPRDFPWFEAPPASAQAVALQLLERLDAIEADGQGGHRLLELGRKLARLPLHPRLARLLIDGAEAGALTEAATCAALLSERSPFRRDAPPSVSWNSAIDSDLVDRMHALFAFEDGVASGDVQRNAARALLEVRDRLVQAMGRDRSELSGSERDEAVARALLGAYPDRLARRRAPGDERALMIDGRGVRLARESTVNQAEVFVCLEVANLGREHLVRIASEVRPEWLSGPKRRAEQKLHFDEGSARVVAEQCELYGDLILDRRPATLRRDAASARVLAKAAGEQLERALDFQGKAYTELVARLRCLGEWMPELELPQPNDAFWLEQLEGLCAGKLSFAELRKVSLVDSLRGAMSWKQLEALERHAPERVQVPSGNHVRLVYEPGRSPVLAARIQELFGWRSAPRIANGKVGLLLHLLAPNMRPQQVTEDLESFWNTTYAEVRKDLRRRYPKHDWPEDPWSAKAKRRPGR